MSVRSQRAKRGRELILARVRDRLDTFSRDDLETVLTDYGYGGYEEHEHRSTDRLRRMVFEEVAIGEIPTHVILNW